MKTIFSKRFIIGIATVLVVAGLAGVLPALYFNSTNKGSVIKHNLPVVSAQPKPDQVLVSGHPVSILVPTTGINLEVINGYYYPKTRDWTLTPTKAQFAMPSVEPNNKAGNTFIYGHALSNVFGNLNKVKPGDLAFITTDNGYKFTYKFVQTYATQPTDLSVLNYQGPPMLTLQTCSGSWYQNRQMYLFGFVESEKI